MAPEPNPGNFRRYEEYERARYSWRNQRDQERAQRDAQIQSQQNASIGAFSGFSHTTNTPTESPRSARAEEELEHLNHARMAAGQAPIRDPRTHYAQYDYEYLTTAYPQWQQMQPPTAAPQQGIGQWSTMPGVQITPGQTYSVPNPLARMLGIDHGLVINDEYNIQNAARQLGATSHPFPLNAKAINLAERLRAKKQARLTPREQNARAAGRTTTTVNSTYDRINRLLGGLDVA